MRRQDILNIKVQTQRIDKVYDIKQTNSKLGKGNFGFVVKGKDKITGQTRAIKIIKIEKLMKVDADLATLEREFQILRNMDHPNIVKLYEVYKDEKYLYFVMEYLEGDNLYEGFIKRHDNVNEKHIRDLFFQIIKAVQYMHKSGIAHRDIKPENIMFVNANSDKIKLIDFGVSKYFFDPDTPTKEITLRTKTGSLFYISPEIASNNKSYDHRCDVWSAGVLLYIMVSGVPPFFDMNPMVVTEKVKKIDYSLKEEVWAMVSKELIDLIKHMLSPLDYRYTTDQVLEHPWMKMPFEEKKHSFDLKTVRSFFFGARLAKYVREIITASVSETDVKNLGNVFVEIDDDGDGLISRDQLINAIRTNFQFNDEELIEEIMNSCKNNDKINYSSFLSLASSVNDLPDYEKRVEKVFRIFDRKKKGQVTAEDIKKATSKLKLFEKESLDFWQSCIDEVDKGKKGYLDIADFKNMVRYN